MLSSTVSVSSADCRVVQPSVGISPNHFNPGLIKDLEYREEHIMNAALFVPTIPTFVPQMFAFARNNGAGPRCFPAFWLRSWGLCHIKSRAQMGFCGTSMAINCQSSLLGTWSSRVNGSQPSMVILHLHLTMSPEDLRERSNNTFLAIKIAEVETASVSF